ncbi:MAG: DUF4034 domain-containing protein [Cyanobacteria bacterium J06600_6]
MVSNPFSHNPGMFKNVVSSVLMDSQKIDSLSSTTKFGVQQQAKIIVRLIKIDKFSRVEEIFNNEIKQQTHTVEGFLYASSLIKEVFFSQFESGLLSHLNKWIEQAPQSHLAYTARAYFYYMAGWKIRGHEFIPDTPEDQVKGYVENLNLSVNDIHKAIELDPSNPLAIMKILTLGRNGWADGDIFESYFTAANEIVPYYTEAYQEKSDFLNPKWHGESEEYLLDFVRRSVRESPRKTAVALLLPQVHRELSWHNDRDIKEYFKQKKVWYEVETNYLRLIEDFPESGFYPLWFAEVAKYMGKNRLARKYFALASKRDVNNPVLQAELQEYKR